MKTAYIVSAYRSAVAKAFRGSLANKRPDDFCAEVISGVLERTPKFDHALIDDVIIGCAMPEAEQGMNVARIALLLAGLPQSVPGVTVNRFCSSGVQTIAMAAHQVQAGAANCVLAGGTESMTLIPMMGHMVVGSRNIMDNHPEFYLGMGLTAENVAKKYNISRQMQDEFALKSHQKAVNAIEKKYFNDEIIPIKVSSRSIQQNAAIQIKEAVFTQDEGPRPDTSIESLAALKPAFMTGGTVTAGTSSQMSDGAGACLVVSEEFLKEHKLTPMARFVSYSVAGVDPQIMGIGPVASIPKALKSSGLKLDQIQRIELNEAFAAQALAVIADLKLNPEIINPTGGAIALGHPLGATGAKLTATLLHGMKRDKQKYGMVTMCIGTGMGATAIFENLS